MGVSDFLFYNLVIFCEPFSLGFHFPPANVHTHAEVHACMETMALCFSVPRLKNPPACFPTSQTLKPDCSIVSHPFQQNVLTSQALANLALPKSCTFAA